MSERSTPRANIWIHSSPLLSLRELDAEVHLERQKNWSLPFTLKRFARSAKGKCVQKKTWEPLSPRLLNIDWQIFARPNPLQIS